MNSTLNSIIHSFTKVKRLKNKSSIFSNLRLNAAITRAASNIIFYSSPVSYIPPKHRMQE